MLGLEGLGGKGEIGWVEERALFQRGGERVWEVGIGRAVHVC